MVPVLPSKEPFRLRTQVRKICSSSPDLPNPWSRSWIFGPGAILRSGSYIFRNRSWNCDPPPNLPNSMIDFYLSQISCGMFHSALLTTDSMIYTWGRNTDGQLGNSKRGADVFTPYPVNIHPITLFANNRQHMEMLNRPIWRVSCGKDYTLAVELESRLFGWGNNSWGQVIGPQNFTLLPFVVDVTPFTIE